MRRLEDCFQETDVSDWRFFPIENGHVVVTDSGKEKVKDDGEILRLLRHYKNDIRDVMSNVRHHLKSGGNSDVYNCGDLTVVKEALGTQSAYYAMQRAENVRCLCEQVLPDYVKVPAHYALVTSTNLTRQYLIMEKVNEGVTIEDIKERNIYPEYRDDIVNTFNELKNKLRDIEGVDQIITDFHEGNIVVDFSTPSSEKPYTFWLLDQ